MELLVLAENLFLEYDDRIILDIDRLEIYSTDRIGIVGKNGVGKSTLLKVLSGELNVSGFRIKRVGSVSYIPQLDETINISDNDAFAFSRLGVAGIDVNNMSGGEATRLKIASVFSQQMHAIFADEPTSHLDQDGIDLLAEHFRAFNGALLLISHDRDFLDAMVNKIWELREGKITEYHGSYSQYYKQKAIERISEEQRFEKINKEKNRLRQAAAEKHSQARRMDKKTKVARKTKEARGRHEKSLGSKQKSFHSAAKNLERRMSSLGDPDNPEQVKIVKFRQNEALKLSNKHPITGNDIYLAFGSTVLLKDASFQVPLGSRVAIIGKNGTGKSSLLRLIMDKDPSLTISPKVVLGHFEQKRYVLDTEQTVMEFMKSRCDYSVSEIRAVLASIGLGSSFIHKSVSALSGGEITKLQLSAMLMGHYNILLMDEPSNYLDIEGIEALERMMMGYSGTILFVTHDNRLIENVATMVYKIEDKKLILQKDEK